MEILDQTQSAGHMLDRTFHVAKRNAGFLGLGAEIEVVVGGKLLTPLLFMVTHSMQLRGMLMHR